MADFAAVTQIEITAKDSTQGALDQVKSGLSGVSSAVGSLQGMLATLGVGLSAGMFAHAIKEAIDYADKLNDLSKITGINVETLGGLGYAGKTAGVELEDIAKGTGKLADLMAKAAGGSAEASAVFGALGVSIQNADGSLTGMDETLFAVADKFASYKDGPEKAALAHEIFGKSGAALIPLLNEGGERLREMVAEYQKYGGITEETAGRADAFNDTLAKLQLMGGAFTRTVASALLPVLQKLADMFVELKGQGGGFGGVVDTIVAGVKILGISAIGVVATFQAVGKALGALAAAGVALANGDFRQAWAALKEGGSDAAATVGSAIDRAKVIWNTSAADMVATSNKHGPNASAPLVKAAKDVEDAILKEWEALEKLREKWLQVLEAQLDGVAPQTLKDLDELARLVDTGQLSWQQYVRAMELVIDKDPVMTKQQDELNKIIEENAKAIEAVIAARAKELTSIDDQIAAQLRANATFGLGKSAVIDYTIAELRRQQADAAGIPGEEAAIDHLQRRIDKLYVLRDAVAMGEALDAQKKALDDAAKAWDGFVNSVGQAFGGFINDWVDGGATKAFRNLWENFKHWALTALAEIAAKQVVVSITGALTTGGASAGGLNTLTGGSGGLGSLTNLLSGSTLTGLFESFATSAMGIALGLGETVATSSAAAIAGGLSLGVEAGATAATGALTSFGAALSTAVPVIGAIAVAGYALYKYLDSKKGGPKTGGFATTGDTSGISNTDSSGRWFTPTEADPALLASLKGLKESFDATSTALGGLPKNIAFALGFDMDPKGNAPSNIHAGVFNNGAQVYNFENPNLGRSEEEVKAATAQQLHDMFLAGLKASGVDEVIITYLTAIPLDKFDAGVQDLVQSANTLAALDTKKIFGEVVDLPKLMELVPAGQTVSATLASLVTTFSATSAVALILGQDVDTAFGAVGLSSLAARESLIAFAGGADNLVSMTTTFYDKFFTDAEKLTMSQNTLASGFSNLQDQFPDLLTSIPTTREEFKNLVMGLDLSTEAGQQLYVGLMKLAPTFDSVATAADKANAATTRLRDNNGLSPTGSSTTNPRDLLNRPDTRNQPFPTTTTTNTTSGNVVDVGSLYSGAAPYVEPTKALTAAEKAALADAQAYLDRLTAIVADVSQVPNEMMAGLLAALGKNSVLDERVDEIAKTMVAFSAASKKLYEQLARDPKAEAVLSIARANETQMQTARRLAGELRGLVAGYDGSAAATDALTAATAAYADAQRDLLVQIDQVSKAAHNMFADSIQSIILAGYTDEQKRQYYLDQAAQLEKLLAETTDPAQIDRLSRLINDDLMAAFNLLSPDEQRASQDQYIRLLQQAEALTKAQLDAANEAALTNEDSAAAVMTIVQDALEAAAAKQKEAAQAIIDAAKKSSDDNAKAAKALVDAAAKLSSASTVTAGGP